jgi:hypothetical protein
MKIPRDPYILLSFINTKLRDEYDNLDSLCHNLEIDRSRLETALSTIGYTYTGELNRFTSLP